MVFDFSNYLPLPFIFGGLIGFAILMYLLLDGFVLGVGILFPFAPSNQCRQSMISSIAPFWDANQTWLVLGGGGLLISFPLAYSILLAAFYIPIMMMLIGLIIRGASFEFYMKETESKMKMLWSYCFHFGSMIAAFSQGTILGGYLQGVSVVGRSFAGSPWDWVSGFSIFCGIALVFCYALIGATWSIMKTSAETQRWARYAATYTSIIVTACLAIIAIALPQIQERIGEVWFHTLHGQILYSVTLILLFLMMGSFWRHLREGEHRPFLLVLGMMSVSFMSLGLSIHPWIVPYVYTLEEAAAATTSLSLILVGMLIVMPVIVIYTAYTYWVFWGKAHHEIQHY